MRSSRMRWAFAAFCSLATAAEANVDISSHKTKNMSCAGGVCAPTARNARLNVEDLADMLAAGDVTVTTTVRARSITVSSAVSRTDAHRLTLDARDGIDILAPVVLAGPGRMSLTTHTGDFAFFRHGSITFLDLGGGLIVDGQAYVLVDSLPTLAAAVTQNPSGHYALADDYDASADGAYKASPVSTTFAGTFEGLGHVIDRLKIKSKGVSGIALFRALDGENPALRNLGVTNANIEVIRGKNHTESGSGILAGIVFHGTIRRCWTTGELILTAQAPDFPGGLVGENSGTILQSWSSAHVVTPYTAGGLVSLNFGTIDRSYFDGTVEAGTAGGIAGSNGEVISNSYVRGTVAGQIFAGGIAGQNGAISVSLIAQSYSTALVTVENGTPGGAIGDDESHDPNLSDIYWDLDTSGVSDPSQGAGNVANDPGITGLSDAALKAQLPHGFDPFTWGQSASTNDGYPYLLALPPQ